MNNILAIESSSSSCSVALSFNGKINIREDHGERTHTQFILPFIEELLNSENIKASDLDAIAFSAGPGSFTGIRLAASIAKSIAYAAKIPVIAISSLAAIAQSYVRIGKNSESCIVATDARMGEIGRNDLALVHRRPSQPRSEAFPPGSTTPSVGFLEAERSGSFFLTGGLAAVHARSRDRNEIFDALERRETYGTSGPRILLWFDLLDPSVPGGGWPMGSEVERADAPTFRVRAAGSFEQKPGCPAATTDALTPDRIASLCLGECYFPSDRRRPITRIEVIRIRTQRGPEEDVGPLIEDPWKTLSCDGDPDGCQVVFSDPEFSSDRRDTSYYVRAIEAASPVIDADPLGCAGDPDGESRERCLELDPCFDRDDDDECLAPSEQRAWSSPIFVDYTSGPS
jgi:hypothetical protein